MESVQMTDLLRMTPLKDMQIYNCPLIVKPVKNLLAFTNYVCKARDRGRKIVAT